MNEILIRGLRARAFIGVPDEERASAQELAIDITLEPKTPFADLGDDLSKTVDYAAVAARVISIVEERPRRLIETLASDIVSALVAEFPARAATVEIRKFILPNTDHVAVRCRAESGSNNS